MRGRGTSQQHGMRNPGQRLHASHFKGVEFNTVGILKIVMIMVECSRLITDIGIHVVSLPRILSAYHAEIHSKCRFHLMRIA